MDTRSALMYGFGAALVVVGGQSLGLAASLLLAHRDPIHSASVLATAVVFCVVGAIITRTRLRAVSSAR